jgi:hypothetical protein
MFMLAMVGVEKLPGGLARVIVPMKLYLNRPRGNDEFYRPEILVPTCGGTSQLFWTSSTATLRPSAPRKSLCGKCLACNLASICVKGEAGSRTANTNESDSHLLLRQLWI